MTTFAPQMQTCLRFLTHCWHFLSEGLPDKFSIDKSSDSTKVRGLETSAPTRLELESDTEDSVEED
jgi:hypothetical protein